MTLGQSETGLRHHLLIAGVGRSGTKLLLVRILDACGLDTELSSGSTRAWDETANAGLETLPISKNAPYVVKSPWAYQFIDQLLDRGDVSLDAVIIPLRPLAEATASRVILELRHEHEASGGVFDTTWRERGYTPGAVVYSLEPLDQARVLAHSLYRLIERLIARDVPFLFWISRASPRTLVTCTRAWRICCPRNWMRPLSSNGSPNSSILRRSGLVMSFPA